jgi:hypothetical protein
MAISEGILIEVRREKGGVAGILDCPRSIQPAPGQYLLAASNDPGETLPVPLFPASLPGLDLQLAPPLPATWLPGLQLSLRGPLGRGFNLPRGVTKLALAAFNVSPAVLTPLASLALQRGAAVAFYSTEPPLDLPMDVESLPLDLLPDALSWADALAAVLAPSALTAFRRACGLAIHQRFRQPAQALLLAPMPCGGTAECGICSIPTAHGWRLACKDGPVFNLNELDYS